MRITVEEDMSDRRVVRVPSYEVEFGRPATRSREPQRTWRTATRNDAPGKRCCASLLYSRSCAILDNKALHQNVQQLCTTMVRTMRTRVRTHINKCTT